MPGCSVLLPDCKRNVLMYVNIQQIVIVCKYYFCFYKRILHNMHMKCIIMQKCKGFMHRTGKSRQMPIFHAGDFSLATGGFQVYAVFVKVCSFSSIETDAWIQ